MDGRGGVVAMNFYGRDGALIDHRKIEALANKQAGKKFFDAFRAKIAEFSGIEAKLMLDRQATAEKANSQVTTNLYRAALIGTHAGLCKLGDFWIN